MSISQIQNPTKSICQNLVIGGTDRPEYLIRKIKTRKQYSGFLIQEVVQGLKLLRRDMSAHLVTEAVNGKSCLKRV